MFFPEYGCYGDLEMLVWDIKAIISMISQQKYYPIQITTKHAKSNNVWKMKIYFMPVRHTMGKFSHNISRQGQSVGIDLMNGTLCYFFQIISFFQIINQSVSMTWRQWYVSINLLSFWKLIRKLIFEFYVDRIRNS